MYRGLYLLGYVSGSASAIFRNRNQLTSGKNQQSSNDEGVSSDLLSRLASVGVFVSVYFQCFLHKIL